MGCTLGRITDLPSPSTIRQDGGRLIIGGSFATTPAEGVRLARQLLAYPYFGEETVPFTYDATEAGGILDGYYFCVDTSVDWAKLASGLFEWKAELDPVPGGPAALTELQISGGLLTNSHSVTSSNAAQFIAYPATATCDTYTALSGYPGIGTSAGATGSVTRVEGSVSGGTLTQRTVLFHNAPADHYHAACTISEGTRVASATAPDVTSHATVVGEQTIDDPTAVLLDNDFMRVLYGPSTGQLIVGQWEDSGLGGSEEWTYKAYKLTRDSTPTSLGDPARAIVLHNRPEIVSVRFYYDGATNLTAYYAEITLRRGALYAEVFLACTNPDGTANHGIYRYTTEAGTTSGVTGGINAASDDSDLNKYEIRCLKAFTADTTNGGIRLTTAAASALFGVATDWHTLGPTLDSCIWATSNPTQQAVAP